MTKSILLSSLFLFAIACAEAGSVEENQQINVSQEMNVIDENTVESGSHITEEKSIKDPELVTFPSLDELTISGIVYEVDPAAPTIVLCHQASYNRHEYDEIGPKLNALGYNCLAIDQRSGGVLFGHDNETSNRAKTQKLPTSYVDAEQDIRAAIDYAHDRYGKTVILWGSSYSSALALHIGGENDKVSAVLSFSPGDYFGDKKPLLSKAMQSMKIPFFITSSKSEASAVTAFLDGIQLDKNHVQFIPNKSGKHGSKALWEDHKNNEEYWSAVKAFLANL